MLLHAVPSKLLDYLCLDCLRRRDIGIAVGGVPFLELGKPASIQRACKPIKDLLHGTFTLAIKDATGVPTGQVVTVDNPEETVRIRVRGSTASVDHVTNTMSRMTDMQGDYEHA